MIRDGTFGTMNASYLKMDKITSAGLATGSNATAYDNGISATVITANFEPGSMVQRIA